MVAVAPKDITLQLRCCGLIQKLLVNMSNLRTKVETKIKTFLQKQPKASAANHLHLNSESSYVKFRNYDSLSSCVDS